MDATCVHDFIDVTDLAKVQVVALKRWSKGFTHRPGLQSGKRIWLLTP
jgi:UDP-glucose 4-epimerase